MDEKSEKDWSEYISTCDTLKEITALAVEISRAGPTPENYSIVLLSSFLLFALLPRCSSTVRTVDDLYQ